MFEISYRSDSTGEYRAKTNFEKVTTEDLSVLINDMNLELILKRFLLRMLSNLTFISFSKICTITTPYDYHLCSAYYIFSEKCIDFSFFCSHFEFSEGKTLTSIF